MPNASVISTMNGKPRELNQGGTGTSAIIFSTDGTTPILLPLPAASQLASGTGTSGRSSLFTVRAWGRVTGGTTTNYTVTLYYGTSITAGSDTILLASTARAVDSANHLWFATATLVVDAVSDKIQGKAEIMIANLLNADAVISNVPTSVTVDANSTLGFVIAGTFSSGNASNAAYLDGFEIVL